MPWIVRNLLRGTLTFKGIGISMPPKGQVDLDALLGRARAEASNQIQVAFEEGYLQTVRRDDGAERPAPIAAGVSEEQLGRFLASLREDMASLRASVAGDVRGELQVVRARIREEKERVLVDSSLNDCEIRARLACLDEQERDLEKNFSEIGRKSAVAGGVAEKADLLSSI